MADAMSDDLYDEPVDNEDQETDDVEIEGGDDLDDEVDAQAKSYVDDDDDEDEADRADDDDEADDEEPEKKKPASRYEKRLQQVISQRKEEQARAAELAQRLQQYEHHSARLQAQYEERMRQDQELRERLVRMETENENYRRQRQLAEEEGLDPAERLKRQAVREALEQAKAERDLEIADMKKDHEEWKRQVQMEKQQVAREQRIAGYDQQARYASASLLEELPTETAEGMYEELVTNVLNWGAAHGYSDLRDAATDFDKFAHKYVLAKMKLKGKANGQRRQKGQRVPSASPTSKRNVKGKPVPTMDQARKKGHEDVLDAMRAARGE